jgi:SAM-dependent methyltransferase
MSSGAEKELTYDLKRLESSQAAWERSPALRAYYEDLYSDVMGLAATGPVLELGSGIGSIRSFHPAVETSDVCQTPFVSRAVSAYEIDATGRPWGAIVAVDVLHHLCHPWRFFRSASESLRDGGRLIMAEPAATPWGRRFYRWCHHEPCEPSLVGETAEFEIDPATDEFANMGLGWALFSRDRLGTERRLAELGLSIVAVRWRDLVAYPATGGFSRPGIAPAPLIRAMLWLERWIPQAALDVLGLRMIIALEKLPRRSGR